MVKRLKRREIKVKTLRHGSIRVQTLVSWCLRWRRFVAPIVRFFSPGYSWCKRCGLPWSVVTGHSTDYTESRACAPLCNFCWKELEPVDRLPFYEILIADWKANGPCNGYDEKIFNSIRKAVIAGW